MILKTVFALLITVVAAAQRYYPEKCPRNEIYDECGDECPLTCANYRNPEPCTGGCLEGCFCNVGNVRDESSGRCVLPQECSSGKVAPYENFIFMCPMNEEFEFCGTSCPKTCQNFKIIQRRCTRNCIIGCFCKNGLIRNTLTGRCVLPGNCPPQGISRDPRTW